ncbi:hypothetical protein [Plasmodium yoelii yoelii]|uniref:Uncharacterized protein n=1 Tax=Plasmodium yoelii yoelii TaxID=73239 RepID=Q7R9X8_PLAYO|nr:hypothetical protein [Plasmodium yoelii yoelii]
MHNMKIWGEKMEVRKKHEKNRKLRLWEMGLLNVYKFMQVDPVYLLIYFVCDFFVYKRKSDYLYLKLIFKNI